MTALPEALITSAREWRVRLIYGDKTEGGSKKEKEKRRRGSQERHQQELRDALSGDAKQFTDYLRRQLQVEDALLAPLPDLPHPLTASEFRNPCLEVEQVLAAYWGGQIHAREASTPAFWNLCHLKWLEAGSIDGAPQATLAGSKDSGSQMSLDSSTRNVIRRLGGLPEVRGYVSVLSDCPLAKAWWRAAVAREAHSLLHDRYSEAELHRMLHAGDQVWAALVGPAVRSIPAVNHPKARAALITTLQGRHRGDGIPNTEAAAKMQAALKALGRLSTVSPLGALPLERLERVVNEAVQDPANVQAEVQERAADPEVNDVET